MAYTDNDPAEIARTKFPDYTDEKRVAIVEIARAMARKDGGGILLLPPVSVDALLNQADRQYTAAAKVKGESDITASELAELEKQRLAFGKAGADAPLKHRGDYLRQYGQAKYDAAMKLWGASATDLTPRKNPFAKPIRKAMRAAREGTLEATPFNLTFNSDQVKAPKPPKVKIKGGPMTMTELGALYKSDPEAARAIAAKNGLKI